MSKYYFILACLQVFIALGAIPAGYGYVSDPSGSGMGTTVGMLANSPFDSFLIPGLFLLIINGLGNTAGAILSFRKRKLAGEAGVLLGVIMLGWISFQVYWIGLSSALQPAFFVIGLVETLLGFLILKHQPVNK